HEAFVRKVVGELNAFDNLYYETCNEPYAGGVALDWQARIAPGIAETESGLPKRHMIAQNVANGSARIADPIPGVSLFNFHYPHPPRALAGDAALGQTIGRRKSG